jgi:hypothetical protein
MAVHIGHTRYGEASDPLGAGAVVDRNLGDAAISADADRHPRCHTGGEECLVDMQLAWGHRGAYAV